MVASHLDGPIGVTGLSEFSLDFVGYFSDFVGRIRARLPGSLAGNWAGTTVGPRRVSRLRRHARRELLAELHEAA